MFETINGGDAMMARFAVNCLKINSSVGVVNVDGARLSAPMIIIVVFIYMYNVHIGRLGRLT